MNHDDFNKLLYDLLNAHNQKKPDIPQRILNQSSEHILKLYAKEYNRLYREVLDLMTDTFEYTENPKQSELMSVMAQIENRLNQLNSTISEEVKKEIQKNYASGHINHTILVNQITDMAVLQQYVPFSLVNSYMAEQLMADTMEDLLFATEHTKKQLKKIIRDTYAKHLSLAGLEGTNYKELMKQIQSELTRKGFSVTLQKDGFVGIIDRLGRKWNLKTYVEMVVNTKMSQAYHEGLKDKAIETGRDLVQISENGSRTPCKYFEGMIISMTGQTKDFMTYDQLKATGMIFHPNCRHTCYPISSIELLHPDDLKCHEDKMSKVGAAIDKYGKKSK